MIDEAINADLLWKGEIPLNSGFLLFRCFTFILENLDI